MIERIRMLKEQLGSRVVLPAHHYQRGELVGIADIVGDSYKLAVEVSRSEAEYILFCGVRFMAEGAAILAKRDQKVVLPALHAGCPMADMITVEQAEQAERAILEFSGRDAVPVVYMNAYGDIKAFSGSRGGAVCTSSNARRIITHYLKQGRSIFFAPDYCLGINTARQLGLPESSVAVVRQDGSISSSGNPSEVRLYLWDGNCRVHQRFSTDQIRQMRAETPEARIIVHPEVPREVAELADETGSTAEIYNRIRAAGPGTVWGVGTEYNFVTRIAAEFPDRRVLPLAVSRCGNMEKVTVGAVEKMLSLIAGEALESEAGEHIVTVSESIRTDASQALKRMITIVEEQ